MNAFNHKYEIELRRVGNYQMAQLIARRLHAFFKENYKGQGYSFTITSGNGKATISLCNSKLSQVPAEVNASAVNLIKTYAEILEPFFPKK